MEIETELVAAVREVESSYAPMLSQPNLVPDVIRNCGEISEGMIT